MSPVSIGIVLADKLLQGPLRLRIILLHPRPPTTGSAHTIVRHPPVPLASRYRSARFRLRSESVREAWSYNNGLRAHSRSMETRPHAHTNCKHTYEQKYKFVCETVTPQPRAHTDKDHVDNLSRPSPIAHRMLLPPSASTTRICKLPRSSCLDLPSSAVQAE